MKLHKFYEFIKEAAEWDQSAIDEMLLPIKDLGFEVQISEPNPVTDQSSHLYKKMVREITIWIKNQYEDKLNSDVNTFIFKDNGQWDRIYTNDTKVFDLMIEFGNLGHRLSEDGTAMNIVWHDSSMKLKLLHVVDDTTSTDKEIELKNVFVALRNKFIRTSTDFVRGMLWEPRAVEEVTDSFSIRCGSDSGLGAFTNRKWSAFVKGIDLSNFKVTFEKDEEDEDVVTVHISLQKD